jgi:hypothetical protein
MKAVMLGVLFFALSSIAAAQSTPYQSEIFTATFNGPIQVHLDHNTQGTSTDKHFSTTGTIQQTITVRTVDHDIDVDKAATDFYATQTLKNGARTLLSRQDGVYKKKHPWTLITFADTRDNVITRWHTWFIIIDSRTVMIVAQVAIMGDHDDNSDWATLIDSLNIKM